MFAIETLEQLNAELAEVYFDGVFLGWGYDGARPNGEKKGVFVERDFLRCLDELERRLDWRFGERFDLLLTDFVYDSATGTGDLDFARCIPLDLAELADEKKLAAVGPLLGELLVPGRTARALDPEFSVTRCVTSDESAQTKVKAKTRLVADNTAGAVMDA